MLRGVDYCAHGWPATECIHTEKLVPECGLDRTALQFVPFIPGGQPVVKPFEFSRARSPLQDRRRRSGNRETLRHIARNRQRNGAIRAFPPAMS